jgi:predicted nucleic-acid-binding Zn-ribbon protein
MKNTRKCPKCESTKLWVVEPLKTVYEFDPGTIPLHLDYDQVEGTTFLTRSKLRVGTLDAWICAACGYTELWAKELNRLKHAPERGVRLIEGGK